jgi:outer membrane biosynthesis protein TonB
MKSLLISLQDKKQEQRGINLVDLMMWLVIAALLIAAAIQSIGYYQQAANVYLMQDEVTGVVANIHAASAIEGGTINETIINTVLAAHNTAHNTDDIVISYGSVTANAAGFAGDSGFERASAVAASSPANVNYLRASSESVEDSYVMYFFAPTRSFPQGITTVTKTRIDSGDLGEVATPGEATPTPTPTPSETATAVPEAEPSATATPTPTETVAPSPIPTPTATETVPPVVEVTPTPTPTPTPPPVVKTVIDNKYDAINGSTVLGAPKDTEKALANGSYRDYANGAIVTSPSGTFVLKGAIRDHWLATGKETIIGYPTADETAITGGLSQSFTKGAIVWSAATGAHHSSGAIRNYWLQWGAETGRMKYPTTDLVCGLVNGGCRQEYQGGAMYWSPATGAFDMGGAFLTTWRGFGGENSNFGYPTGGETWINGYQTRQNFQGGHYLLWNNTTGTVTVH